VWPVVYGSIGNLLGWRVNGPSPAKRYCDEMEENFQFPGGKFATCVTIIGWGRGSGQFGDLLQVK
jgi:hypothetical protein